MYTPMYRFRYKFDPKQNKYIPTNEWFMDKVVYRKRGGNLNKLPFMQKGKPIPRPLENFKNRPLTEFENFLIYRLGLPEKLITTKVNIPGTNQPLIRKKSPVESLQDFVNFIISPKEYISQQKPKEFKEIIKINKN